MFPILWGQKVTILGFEGSVGPVTTTQPYHCSVKVAIDNK